MPINPQKARAEKRAMALSFRVEAQPERRIYCVCSGWRWAADCGDWDSGCLGFSHKREKERTREIPRLRSG